MIERGRSRVYLGAAPGVGKTVAMLNEGHRPRDEGHDVVIGFVEAHGRAETTARIGDLEIVPRRRVEHRGVALDEMDVDAILARKPELALVDELAHTNAPGSARAKRWDDVRALLDAGIDVLTTLNVQHLESLNDVVKSITGVQVNETVPDSVLDDADVQLVDLPVDALIERLRRGNIYPEATAKRALDNFFRAGNLNALRELSLRRMADGVDDHLERYMRDHEIEQIWPAAERVLVLVEGGHDASRVLRRAWRLASAMRAELIAAVVAPDTPHPDIARAIELAEDLGAEVRMLEGPDLAVALAGVAKAENASVMVIGYAPRAGWRARFDESLVDRLLKAAENVDLLVVEPRPQSRLPS